jgi:hypothetical protein
MMSSGIQSTVRVCQKMMIRIYCFTALNQWRYQWCCHWLINISFAPYYPIRTALPFSNTPCIVNGQHWLALGSPLSNLIPVFSAYFHLECGWVLVVLAAANVVHTIFADPRGIQHCTRMVYLRVKWRKLECQIHKMDQLYNYFEM